MRNRAARTGLREEPELMAPAANQLALFVRNYRRLSHALQRRGQHGQHVRESNRLPRTTGTGCYLVFGARCLEGMTS